MEEESEDDDDKDGEMGDEVKEDTAGDEDVMDVEMDLGIEKEATLEPRGSIWHTSLAFRGP